MILRRWVFYVNVGNLPKAKAEDYINEVTKRTRDGLKLPDEEPLLVMAVRGEEETRLTCLY